MRGLLVGITSALGIAKQTEQQQQQELTAYVKAKETRSTPSGTTMTDVQDSCPGASSRARATDCSSVHAPLSGSNDFCFFAKEKSADLPFTMLLVTQNIGGVASSRFAGSAGGEGGGAGAVAAEAAGLSGSVRQRVEEFLSDLRLFIYEASRREFDSHRQKKKADFEKFMPSPSDFDGDDVKAVPLLDVIVVHFQEIGGTHLDMEFNCFFAEALSKILPEAAWCSGLLMETDNDSQQFTALGSIVFLSQRMFLISSILSFRHRTFVAVADDPATYCSSSKFLFHSGKFSGAGASRKGYLLLSLRFGTVIVNFLNLHLYNDVKNTDAAGTSPSEYARQRQEAILEAMAECMVFISPHDPLFIFGDFNTRLDAYNLLRYMQETLKIEIGLAAKNVQASSVFWDLFTATQHLQTIKKFDVEMQRMMDTVAQQSGVELAEFPIYFPPTYLRPLVDEKLLDGFDPHRNVVFAEESEEGDQKKEERVKESVDPSCGADGGDTAKKKKREVNEGYERSKKKVRNSADKHDEGVVRVPQRIMEVPLRGYNRQRIPAWCDRVVWNPAGMEFVFGWRSSLFSPYFSQSSVGKDGGLDASCQYMYRSFAFRNTDHDCVALLF